MRVSPARRFTSKNIHFPTYIHLQRRVRYLAAELCLWLWVALVWGLGCVFVLFFLQNTLENRMMLQNTRYQQALRSDQANVLHPFGRIGLDITTQHCSETEPWLSEVTAKVGRQTIFHSGLLLLITQKIPEVPDWAAIYTLWFLVIGVGQTHS